MCALDVHPREKTLCLPGGPRAALQASPWGMHSPRASGYWLRRLSSGAYLLVSGLTPTWSIGRASSFIPRRSKPKPISHLPLVQRPVVCLV